MNLLVYALWLLLNHGLKPNGSLLVEHLPRRHQFVVAHEVGLLAVDEVHQQPLERSSRRQPLHVLLLQPAPPAKPVRLCPIRRTSRIARRRERERRIERRREAMSYQLGHLPRLAQLHFARNDVHALREEVEAKPASATSALEWSMRLGMRASVPRRFSVVWNAEKQPQEDFDSECASPRVEARGGSSSSSSSARVSKEPRTSPGFLMVILRYSSSSGCMRNTNSLGPCPG